MKKILHNAALNSLLLIIFCVMGGEVFGQGDSWVKKAVFIGEGRQQAISFSIGSKGYVGTGINMESNRLIADFWEYDAVADTWAQKADFPGGKRIDALGFSIEGKGYAGIGVDSTFALRKDFWEYDPASNTWIQKADFGGRERSAAAGFSIKKKGYIGTGFSYEPVKDFWEYDPLADTWTGKADFPGLGRYGTTNFSIGNKGYIGFGKSESSVEPDFWEYDPANDHWTQKGNFAETRSTTCITVGNIAYVGSNWKYDPAADLWTAVSNPAGEIRPPSFCFSLKNKGYMVYTYPFPGLQNDCWELTPEASLTDSWVEKAAFVEARSGAIGFSIGNKGYMGMGANKDGSVYRKDLWEYDPVNDTWSQQADFGGTGRLYAIGFSIGNKGYVGCGNDGYNHNDFWEYNPVTNIWTQKADFRGEIRIGALGFSIGNKGYIGTGVGSNGGPGFRDFWQYNPAGDTWTRKADFAGASGFNSLSFSIGDKGYMGMAAIGNTGAKDFWQYDPAMDTWTRKADFGGGARYRPISFSIGSKGYAAMGGGAGAIQKDLWEYDPVTNAWTKRADFPSFPKYAGIAFNIGSKGYIGLGTDSYTGVKNDFWEYTPAGAVEHTINVFVENDSFCSKKTYPVNYTATGTFNSGNSFTVQLSNAAGSFVNPVNIGTIKSTTGGSINAVIPAGVAAGTGYRIRVISSDPAITGSDNGTALSINPPPLVKTNNITVYLDANGRAVITPAMVNNGSVGYCGSISYALNKTTFTCSGKGANTVILTAKDCNGSSSTGSAIVTIVDNRKPAITGICATPNTLWPPDHKMKLVTLHYTAADNCGVVSTVLSVTSNEPACGSQPDWIVQDDHHVLLRAEASRRHHDERRIYTITITVKDGSGNTTRQTVTVPVAHQQHYTAHNKTNNSIDAGSGEEVYNELGATVMPNPSNNYFTLVIHSNSNAPVTLRVQDAQGKLTAVRTNIAANSTIALGSTYRPGMYFVQLIQGAEMVTIRLMKE